MAVVVTKKKKKSRGGKSVFASRGVIWIAVLAIIAVVAVVCVVNTSNKEEVISNKDFVVAVGDEKIGRDDAERPAVAREEGRGKKAEGNSELRTPNSELENSSELRAPSSDLEEAPPPPKKKEPLVVKPPQVPKIFDNEVEDWLESMSKEGFSSIVTPRVDLSDEEIMAILKTDIIIYEDDDEETVAAKERTAQVKQEAIKYIEEGGTFNQFLRAYADAVREEQETRKDVQEEMKRILFSEGEEAAQAYLDEANPKLEEMNIKPVTIGRGLLMQLERRRAQESEAEPSN